MKFSARRKRVSARRTLRESFRPRMESLEPRLALAGDFAYGLGLGSTGNDVGLGVALDAAGNSYISGRFEGTVDFDASPSVTNLNSAGGQDAFIAKYSPAGSLLWARSLGGSGIEEAGGVAVDAQGNVYAAGSFQGSVDFDPGAATDVLISAGGSDGFAVKLNADGDFVWARQFGGTGDDSAAALALSSTGDVLITGSFTGFADFYSGGGVFTMTSRGREDAFVLKLNSSGDFTWARQLGGTGSDRATGIAVDSSGGVVSTGIFTGTADFDPGEGMVNRTSFGSNGLADIYYSKLDSAGNFLWARSFGSSNADESGAVAVDKFGSVFVTGGFQAIGRFDSAGGVYQSSSFTSLDVIVARLDPNGNVLWAHNFGSSEEDKGFGLAVDSAENVYIAGQFGGTVDFDPGANTSSLSSSGGADAFLNVLNRDGVHLWSVQLGGGQADRANAIAINASGSVALTGAFSGIADLDPTAGQYDATSGGQHDLFLTHLIQVAPEIRGTLWNDTNVNGIRDDGEAVLPGRMVYLDQNQNERIDADEHTAVTDSSGNYAFTSLTPGTYVVRQFVEPDRKQTTPNLPANILVTHYDQVHEYTRSGSLVRTLDVPWPGGSGYHDVHDVIADRRGRIHVFQGGSYDGFISTYDPVIGFWQHHTHPGLSGSSNVNTGEISVKDDYLYLWNIRFNLNDWSSERFSIETSRGFSDLHVGLDGLLYGVSSGSPQYRIYVFDPVDYRLIREFDLHDESGNRLTIWGVAANEAGEIFVADISGRIFRYSSTGVLQEWSSIHNHYAQDLDLSQGGDLIAGNRSGRVGRTDEMFSSFAHFTVGDGATFTAFSTYQGIPRTSAVVSLQWGQSSLGVDFGSVQLLVAADDAYAAAADQVLVVSASVGVLANDAESSGTLSAILVDAPQHGTLTLQADGGFTYSPDAGFTGVDTITYRANDGFVDSALVTVWLLIGARTDLPIAHDQTFPATEDLPASLALAVNDGDAMAEHTLTFHLLSAPSHGILSNFDAVTGRVTYTPDPGYFGSDTFIYSVTRGDGSQVLSSGTATVQIGVAAINDAPQASAQSLSLNEDGSLAITLSGDDGDPQTQSLTYAIAVLPSHGQLVDFNPLTGTATYWPNANYYGVDSFRFTVTDDASAGGAALTSTAATVSINVLPVNDPPRAVDDALVIAKDSGPVRIDVLANDSTVPEQGETLSVIAVNEARHGSVAISPDSAGIDYTPAANFQGEDSFSYTVSDGNGGTAIAKVTIRVGNPRNEVIVTSLDAGHQPLVRVFDAEGGQVVRSIMAFNPGFTGGVRIAMADVNGDGADDIIAAAGPGGGPHVRVFDGNTGDQLPGAIGSFFAYNTGFTGGVFVAAGDINGDGYADIVTGADAGGGPHVRVFSGHDGSELGGFFADHLKFNGGVRVALGDIDFDGTPEIVTGSGPGGPPRVQVFDNAFGLPLAGPLGSFLAYNAGFTGGIYVAAGDLDGDGHADIITGAGAGGGPHVKAFSGATGDLVRDFFAYDAAFTGGVRVAVGDLDGDGLLDILTGAGPTGGPHIRGLDGKSLDDRSNFFAYDRGFTGGVFVAGRPPVLTVQQSQADSLLTAQSLDQSRSSRLFHRDALIEESLSDEAPLDKTLLSPVSSDLNAALVDTLLASEW